MAKLRTDIRSNRLCPVLTMLKARMSSFAGAIISPWRPANNLKRSEAVVVLSCEKELSEPQRKSLLYLNQLTEISKYLLHICYQKISIKLYFFQECLVHLYTITNEGERER